MGGLCTVRCRGWVIAAANSPAFASMGRRYQIVDVCVPPPPTSVVPSMLSSWPPSRVLVALFVRCLLGLALRRDQGGCRGHLRRC